VATAHDFEEKRRRERLQRQRKQRQRMKMIQGILFLILLILIVVIIVAAVSKCSSGKPNTDNMDVVSATAVPYVSPSPAPVNTAENTADMTIPSPTEGKNNILDVIKDSGQKKHVYLTFDEGPDIKVTAQILDVLRRYNVKATFFMIGENIEKSPQMCTRVIQEGHLAAPLSYSADYDILYADKDNFIAEIEKTYQLIADCTPDNREMFRIMRFPGGSYDESGYGFKSETYKNSLARSNYYFADWNCTVGDSSSQRSADALLKYFTQNRPQLNNLVIKLHNSSSNSATAEMLDSLIKQLLDEGYTFSRLDEIDFSNASQINDTSDSDAEATQAPSQTQTQTNSNSSSTPKAQAATAAPAKTSAPSSGSSSAGAGSSSSSGSSSANTSSTKNNSSSSSSSSSNNSSSGSSSSNSSASGSSSSSQSNNSAASNGSTSSAASSAADENVLETE
jgi:peptidoglycan/xylan/chitin deacetylase (PgdA/CDA1 family)